MADAIPCVRVKDGVDLAPMTPTLVRLLGAVDMCARMMGIELTVTCGREAHPADDPHTEGRAIDVRANDLDPAMILRIVPYLKTILQQGEFTVLYEVPATPVNGALKNLATVNPGATAPHFHLQSSKGTIYPPQDAA